MLPLRRSIYFTINVGVIRGEVRGKKHIPTSCVKLFFNIILKDFAEIPCLSTWISMEKEAG
jgi:hypothetical protein